MGLVQLIVQSVQPELQ